jgi:ABC-type phosphate transport system substrate-binding protein
MRSFSRRLRLASVLTACAAAALVAPGVASATGHCEGPSIEGNGATFQGPAQKLWNTGFNNTLLTGSCEVGKFKVGEPTVTYKETGSGPGLKSWGNGAPGTGDFSAKNAFVGTDEPPNKEQKENIEKEGEVTSGKLLTIPVVQGADTIVVHLPTGCTVKDKVAPGRLVLSNASLERIFHGTLINWKEIKDSKEKFKGKKGACNVPIKRVVRKEGSGTTSIFKKYLNLETVAQGAEEFEVEGIGKTTWKKLAESNTNTTWPEEKADPVVPAAGGGAMASTVFSTPSTIGYVDLAHARKAGFGAATGEIMWAEIEHGTFLKGKKVLPTYAEPSSDGESTVAAQSNCEETLYTDGKNKFPPVSTESLWNEVTTSLVEPNYPICGFSYDLSTTKFKGYGVASGKPATEESVQTADDYLKFELSGGAGQLVGSDYLGLPENAGGKVKKIAEEGLLKIAF